MQATQYQEPRSNIHEQGIDSIYLRMAVNNKQGHYIMDLATGRELKQGGKIMVSLLSNTIYEIIEDMGNTQGIKKLKFPKVNWETLPPEALLQGEDYDIRKDHNIGEEESKNNKEQNAYNEKQ